MTTAEDLGLITPKGTDPISQGDDAISHNAERFAEIYDEIVPKLFHRGLMPVGADANDFFTTDHAGSWTFSGSRGASILNLPDGVTAGQLTVLPELGGQIVTSYAGVEPAIYFRGRRALSGTQFGPWMNLNNTHTLKNPGMMAANTNVNWWYGPGQAGVWLINSQAVADTIVNLPVPEVGQFINLSAGYAAQVFMAYGTGGRAPSLWYRSLESVVGRTWTDWVNLLEPAGSSDADTDQYALKHSYRVDDARKRRGYRIGTAGKAQIALQFDDNHIAFQDVVLPVLREFDLPATMAVTVDLVEGTRGGPHDGPVPWDTVQSWLMDDGCEVQGHSWSHGAASTPSQLRKEIIESADYMESQMRHALIDSWSMPGTGQSPPYGGYQGRYFEDFTETLAGKLLMSRYAFVFATKGGWHQPGGATNLIGQAHYSADSATVQEFKDTIEYAIRHQYAVTAMLHPSWIGDPGRWTQADLYEAFQWLAAQRDAGRIIITTRTATALFDPATDYRHDMLPGIFDGDLHGWTGWTLNSEGRPETGGTTPLSYELDVLAVNWVRGSTREYHARVRSMAGAQVRLSVTGSDLSATKVYTIPAGEWTEIRKFFTVPVFGQRHITFTIERISGGTIEIQQASALAA